MVNRFGLFVALAAAVLMAVPGIALAEETEDSLLPQETVFHIDTRWVTIMNLAIENWEDDEDPETTMDSLGFGGSLGTSGLGTKLGWLVGGNNDVGFHVMAGAMETLSEVDPGGPVDAIEYRDTNLYYRAAFYYNYNWHPNDWVMPYFGPLVGIRGVNDWSLIEGNDDNTTYSEIGLFGGAEVGVKLFPYDHVAFDIGAIATYSAVQETFEYVDATGDDVEDDATAGVIDVAAYVGLNIYFGKDAEKKCPSCPECPKPVVVVPKPTTLTVMTEDKCSGQALGTTITVKSAKGRDLEIANASGAVTQGLPAGNYTIEIAAPGYQTETQDIIVAPQQDNAVKVALYEEITLTDTIYFDLNKATIKPVSFPVLDDVVTQIGRYCEFDKIVVEGHTDSQGDDDYNLNLSRERAASVRDYLVKKGVPADKLETMGYGESRPVATNDTKEGRAQNRRVEFVIED